MRKVIFSVIFTIILSLAIKANAAILFQDNFEYVVNRNQTGGASSTFSAMGGWTWAKTRQDEYGATSNGYMYTVNSIPGYSGTFPGRSSARVLCMEFLPASLGGQTDAYLALGGPPFPGDKIPARVWFQFWIYFQRYGDQMSRFSRGKFLYPSRTGDYPASPNNGLDWLLTFSDITAGWPYGDVSLSAGRTQFLSEGIISGNTGAAHYNLCDDPYRCHKIGRNQGTNLGIFQPNVWTLVKIHFDTSGSSSLAPSGQGVFRMWTSTNGTTWTTIASWIGQVTPNFTWTITNPQGGHKILKLGTTVDNYDSWWYLDDFVMANSEADLPVYSGGNSPAALSPPSNLRIQ